MTLIVAEKPSLARNIAAGIGTMQRRSGYLEGEGYLITWAFGHLFGLADVEAYQPAEEANNRWTLKNLPCFPKEFRYELRRGPDKQVDDGVRKQFEIITALCNRPDVTCIVNAGDADREGEIIVRTCVKKALREDKPLLRLWLPDQTPETVRAALADLKPESSYDLLAAEGYARTYIDWLYGVNLTRYATLKTGTLLRVGRVIVPIVRAIYDRDLSIRNFVPEPYFALVSKAQTNGETVELVSKRRFTKDQRDQAQAAADALNAAGGVVTAKKSKKDTLSPGKLYSLSTLQNVLGKKYKMSMADSLEIIQGLYEKGYLTYPRTNSEYLATAEKDKIAKILSQVGKMGYPVRLKESKQIFDDSKIESHSALTPTYRIPEKNALSERETQVYATVFRRFVAVFCSEECKVERTEMTVAVGDEETFTLKGMVMLEPGFTRYDDYNRKDKVLPNLSVGDRVNVDFQVTEKETTPPRHYTIETLNNYLKNPFREEKAAAEAGDDGIADDSEDYRAVFEGLELGTEATRTGIIDNARKSGYIALKKDVYSILPGGEFLIESLEQLKIRMDKHKTCEMGQALKKVYHGQMTVEQSVEMAEEEIAGVFRREVTDPLLDIGCFGDQVGVCPLCGRPLIRGKYSYGCSGYREGCTFRVGLRICGRTITLPLLRQILSDGQSEPITDFVSKAGKPFTARLVLKDGRVEFLFDR